MQINSVTCTDNIPHHLYKKKKWSMYIYGGIGFKINPPGGFWVKTLEQFISVYLFAIPVAELSYYKLNSS